MQELPADDKAKIISLVGREVPQSFRPAHKDPFLYPLRHFLHFLLNNDTLGLFGMVHAKDFCSVNPHQSPFLPGLVSEHALIEKRD